MFKKLFVFILLIFTHHLTNRILAQQSTLTISLPESTAICPNDSALIDVTITGQNPVSLTYQATINGSPITKTVESNSNNFSFFINHPGNYIITEFKNSTADSISSIQFVIFEASKPDAFLSGGGNFCENENIDPILLNVTGVSPWEITYQVNFGNAIIQAVSSNSTVLSNIEGTINIRKIKDRYCEAEVRDTNYIQIDEIPVVVIIGEQELCVGQSATYSTNYAGKYNHDWTIPAEATREGEYDLDTNITVKWEASGTFNLELIVSIPETGCSSGRIFYPVTIFDYPESVKDYDTVTCFESDGSITLQPARNEENVIFWLHSGETSSSAVITEAGTYYFIESVPFGCSDTGNIRVIDKCLPEIFVPEAFTPNGDGINDILELFGVFYNLRFYIYSANGELVYSKLQGSPNWDGNSNGKEMINGAYLWKAYFTDRDGVEYGDNGEVILIR